MGSEELWAHPELPGYEFTARERDVLESLSPNESFLFNIKYEDGWAVEWDRLRHKPRRRGMRLFKPAVERLFELGLVRHLGGTKQWPCYALTSCCRLLALSFSTGWSVVVLARQSKDDWELLPHNNKSEENMNIDKTGLKVLATLFAAKTGCEIDVNELVDEAYEKISAVEQWKGKVGHTAGHYTYKGYDIRRRNIVSGVGEHTRRTDTEGQIWQVRCNSDADKKGKICRTLGLAVSWIDRHGKATPPEGLESE